MKKIRVILIVSFLILSGSFFNQMTAQDKTKEAQEKAKAEQEMKMAEKENLKAEQEYKLQMVIEEQKKALTDQKKKMDQLVKEGLITQEVSESEILKQEERMNDLLKNIEINIDEPGLEEFDGGRWRIINQRGGRSYTFDPSVYELNTPGVGYFYGHSLGSDAERTTWDFSKSMKEKTFSDSYNFNVEKTIKNVVMSVNGDCKVGEIRIKIVLPNGKNYSDIVIDEFGNLNWRKSFNISETENQDKTGEWKFQITSTKATGYFKISIQTY